MRYVRRGLALAGVVGAGVVLVRRRRRPDPLLDADRQFAADAAEGWTGPTAVSTTAGPEPVAAAEPVTPAADPGHLAYLPHLQNYHQDVDQDALRGVVRHCGIALRNRDAAIVSAGDPIELKRIRESFLKKKLGLNLSDAELDAAIGELMGRMTGDRAKSRVTVYYLLADRYGKLDLFR